MFEIPVFLVSVGKEESLVVGLLFQVLAGQEGYSWMAGIFSFMRGIGRGYLWGMRMMGQSFARGWGDEKLPFYKGKHPCVVRSWLFGLWMWEILSLVSLLLRWSYS